MSTMMTTSVPSLGFAEAFRADSVSLDSALLDNPSLLSPMDVQFNFEAFDPSELDDYNAVANDLVTSSLAEYTPGYPPAGDAGFAAMPERMQQHAAPFAVYADTAGVPIKQQQQHQPNQFSTRVVGGDATNKPHTRTQAASSATPPKKSTKRKAAQVSTSRAKEATSTTASPAATGKKKKAKSTAASRKAAAAARKRSKMPEEEQKRRNCESAKRSRLKKMKELEIARTKVQVLNAELDAYRAKFEEIRDVGFGLAMHLASHHKGCECGCYTSQLEKALQAPMLR